MGWIKGHWNLFTVILLTLSAGWIAITAAFIPAPDRSEAPAPRIGHTAPNLELVGLDGEQYALSDQIGKVVLINFWASWCPPCKAEMPDIQKLSENYAGMPVTILSINATSQDDLASVKAFVTSYGLTFPVLLDMDGDAANTFRVQALPTSFFIDQFGVIRKIIYGGPLTAALMRVEIDHLLVEAP